LINENLPKYLDRMEEPFAIESLNLYDE